MFMFTEDETENLQYLFFHLESHVWSFYQQIKHCILPLSVITDVKSSILSLHLFIIYLNMFHFDRNGFLC